MKALLKIISYPFSVLFYLFFGITILVFHPIQWAAFNWFGYTAHKKTVDVFNWTLLRCLHAVGTTYHIDIDLNVPNDVPIIIVSNHQSMWEISVLSWYLRKYHPKFISKVELGKGIPSISFNLRHGGSILIDRKNPRQAIVELVKFSKYLQKFNRSGVIFPEGTRSKTGVPKPFRRSGLQTLFKKVPDGYVIPVTINNSWKLQRYGMFPIQMGVRLEMTTHPAIKISDFDVEALIDKVEETVTSKVHNN
ncbi:lysophospholipid acyltransferase family protein [Aequorivita capsosiphonis]|uniref:lysophospholipid acyltransferase family protein n=1 Tax=Aequorivita capsosiphonis TaxID=487317 RepID=UPI0004294C66|nr:lysophospholipid acyltransferase family protein [Aequorivita capsosiphonis]